MKKLSLTLLCSLTLAAAAPAADFHEAVNVIGRDISIVRAVTNTAAFSLATNYANSTVSYTPTGTWYYALQPTNSSGRLAAGAITSQTISATGRIVKLTWNKVAGMSGYRIVFGAASTNMTNIAVAAGGANATNWFHFGTNTFTGGIASNTFTNSAAFVLPDGTRIDGVEDLGSPSAVTNGGFKINGVPVGNGSNVTVAGSTDTNEVRSILNASTNISARLLSNVWDSADSTTNYVRRTGGAYTAADGASWEFSLFGGLPTLSMAPTTSNLLYIGSPSTFLEFDVEQHAFRVTGAQFEGDGAGLTNVTAMALNGNAAQSLLTNNLVIQGAAPVTVTTAVGGNITTATVGIAASALMRNQRGFIFRGSEGSLQAAFVEPIHIPPGGDYISVRTATNALTVNNYIQTLSTITATSIAYVAFNHMMTGAIPWVVVANQPVGDYVFSAYDYSGAQSVVITQTVAAANTWYYTNLPLSINAFIGKIEARVRTTNSANLYQGGIDVRVSP